jgi:hypothetical protein
MNQDGHDTAIAIDIIHLLSVGEHNPKTRDSLVYVCPLLRCMMACDEAGDAFDAVLGCPLLLPDESVFDTFSERPRHVREAVCLSLFHAVNWVRELINTFYGIEGMDSQAKTVARIGDLLELEAKLEECVSRTPSFVGVLVSISVLPQSDVGGVGNKRQRAGTSSGRGGGKRGTNSKAVEDSNDGGTVAAAADDEDDDSDATTTVKRKKTSAKGKRKAKPKTASQQVSVAVDTLVPCIM